MTSSYRVRRILVPVDGSEYARFAVEHAVRLAQTYDAEVVFLCVVDEQLTAEFAEQHALEDGASTRDRLLEQGRVCLRDAARAAEAGGVRQRTALEEGDPCAIICDTAAREAVDLIVMGKIGRRGARRILMGSMTRRVIESVDRPVLVVTAPPAGAVADAG